VTGRGNERKAIFRDDTHRTVFLDKLKASLEIYQVQLHAYVMNNHFHLMIQTPKANLPECMNARQSAPSGETFCVIMSS
jgi:putative transposase